MIIRQDLFSEAVRKVVTVCERSVGSTQSLQHFFYIKLDGTGSSLKLSASNMMRRIEIVINEVSRHEPFCIGVQGSYLNSLLSSITAKEIELKVNGQELAICFGDTNAYHLPIIKKDSFPEAPIITGEWVRTNLHEFFKTISKLSFCTDLDSGRQVYTKAVCILKDLILCTDGYRMCFIPNTLLNIEEPILFPIESIKSFSLLFEGVKEGFISYDEGKMHFSYGGYYASTALVNGKIPNFNSVIPKDACVTCTINKEEIQSVLKRIATCSKLLPVEFMFGNDSALVSIKSDVFRGCESIACGYKGPVTKMSFNQKFISQAIKSLSGENAIFEVRGSQMPFLITDERRSTNNVIMPQREI